LLAEVLLLSPASAGCRYGNVLVNGQQGSAVSTSST